MHAPGGQEEEARIEEFAARQEGLSKSDIRSRQPADKGFVTASTMGRSLRTSDTGEHAADTSFWVPQDSRPPRRPSLPAAGVCARPT